MTTPPYYCFVLDSTRSQMHADDIPRSLRGFTSPDCWQNFWSNIHPFVCLVEDIQQRQALLTYLMYVSAFVLYVLVEFKFDWGPYVTLFILWHVLDYSLFFLRQVTGYVLHNRLKDIRNEFQEIEMTLFRHHGWGIQCEFVSVKTEGWSLKPNLMLCLYFIPLLDQSIPRNGLLSGVFEPMTRQGYLRVQHFTTGHMCQDPKHLQLYHVLPIALLPADTDGLWTTFWFEFVRRQAIVSQLYRDIVLAYYTMTAAQLVTFPIVFIFDSDKDGNDRIMNPWIWFVFFIVAYLVILRFALKLVYRQENDRRFICETSAALSQKGLYMESRTVWDGSKFYYTCNMITYFPCHKRQRRIT